MANRDASSEPSRKERRARPRGIDWDLEGSTPPNETRSRTDAGYDEAAHRGEAYGIPEGHGGPFGTSGGGSYAGGFQVVNRTGSPRGDFRRGEIDEVEGIAPWNGPYAGRGPRGFRRSDERIADEIHDRLERHGWIDATEIEVEVREGEVTLGGRVPDRRMRRDAEDVVEAISGVRHVRNDLRVES